ILTERAPGVAVAGALVSESTKAIPYPFKDAEVASWCGRTGVGGMRVGDVDEAFGFEVRDEDAGNAQRNTYECGDLGARPGRAAHPQDSLALWLRFDAVVAPHRRVGL